MDEAGDRRPCAGGRVVTFSLADEPSSGARFDEAQGFWSYVEQVREALDALRIDRAAICGVSYGGLIAAAFAARYPGRVSSLILVSALPPSWRPDARVSFYLRFPWLLTPLFCLGSLRLYGEIAAANDTLVERNERSLRRRNQRSARTCSTPAAWRAVCICSARASPKGVEDGSSELAGVKIPDVGGHRRRGAGRVVPPRSRANTLRSGRMRAPRRLSGPDTWD